MVTRTVRTAGKADIKELAHVLGRAFFDDPVMTWVLPDPGERARALSRVFATMARHHHLPSGGVEFAPQVDEQELLTAFWDIARRYDEVVTFNGRGFDVPFLYLRSALLNVPISRKDWLGYRFATEPHCDLAEQFTFYNVSGRDGAAAFAFTNHLPVVLDTGRRGRKHEAVLMIVIGVEDERDVIAVGELHVADLFARNNRLRLAVEHAGANVEREAVGGHANLRALRRWHPFVELALHELRDRCAFLPHRFVQPPIDGGRCGDTLRVGGGPRTGTRGARQRVGGRRIETSARCAKLRPCRVRQGEVHECADKCADSASENRNA